MELKYARYDFTPILGWSISRYEVFDKCKRQYFYQYYSKFVRDIPLYKIRQLRELTSVPLEVGNVVHDVLEAFLRRLQKSDSDIDEERFYKYAEEKAREYFSTKTFLEVRYGAVESIAMPDVYARIRTCLRNFMGSPVYSWIYMNALKNKNNWMIEPPGYGETRLNGLKAYCKMDFLLPLENEVAVLDWKTGKRDQYKHASQVIAYAAAASNNFGIPMERIYPRIVYLYPEYGELEVNVDESHLEGFYTRVRAQTEEMYA
ncbi:MAG: hypothetical protein GF331_25820, partial [Chitinivibrionales bacterium]|nr:hypothetical protein [Chitinivibrionales bacterium]